MIDQRLIDQADELISEGEAVLQTAAPTQTRQRNRGFTSEVTSRSLTDYGQWSEWRSRAMSFLHRMLGEKDPYTVAFGERCDGNSVSTTQGGLGILRAVRKDMADGNLARLPERVRANVFSDFLEMAEHLQTDGFQDAAAVLGGGVLEEKLRLLCAKEGIQTTSGNKPKKAELMNTELYKAGVFDLNEQKQVTAWLGIRNDPAHGHYNKYTPQQVALFLAGIRDFISRHPA